MNMSSGVETEGHIFSDGSQENSDSSFESRDQFKKI